MPHTVVLPNGYTVSDDRDRLDMGFVQACLAGTYWAADRPAAQTERSWANCLCFGLYAPDGAIVGFGRLLTDYTFRAHLGDVFVHDSVRGLGLGKALVATILAHPELTTVRHWTLATTTAHTLYTRFGFVVDEGDGNRMILLRPA